MKNLFCGAVAALALSVVSDEVVAQWCAPEVYREIKSDPSIPLTLERAVARAGNAAPEVRKAVLEVKAALAEADQAGRWMNPVISVETENFAGTGSLDGFDAYETTVVVEQTIQLGGKRRLSERAARAQAALSSAECRAQRLEVMKLAGELFLELRAAVELNAAKRSSAELAEQLVRVVERRVEAGAAAPPELFRVKAEAAKLQAAADAAAGVVDLRANALASVWGSAHVDFGLPLAADFGLTNDLSSLNAGTDTHPKFLAAQAGSDVRAAVTERERAGAWPDLTVSAGVRRFEATGERAFLVGVRVPLPLFDRNRDAARAAKLRTDIAAVNARATQARLTTQKSSLEAQARAAQSRLRRLRDEALPLAEDAYEAAAEGYRIGKFDLTATLDARRTLVDTRAAVISARLALQTQMLRLRALVGVAPFAGENQ